MSRQLRLFGSGSQSIGEYSAFKLWVMRLYFILVWVGVVVCLWNVFLFILFRGFPSVKAILLPAIILCLMIASLRAMYCIQIFGYIFSSSIGAMMAVVAINFIEDTSFSALLIAGFLLGLIAIWAAWKIRGWERKNLEATLSVPIG